MLVFQGVYLLFPIAVWIGPREEGQWRLDLKELKAQAHECRGSCLDLRSWIHPQRGRSFLTFFSTQDTGPMD